MNTNKIVLAIVIATLILVLKLCSDKISSKSTSDSITANAIHETGRINTVADGVELGKVNLWSSTTSDRTIRCSVVKGQKVRIKQDADPYYYVEAVGRSGCEGYCMKEFVEHE